MDESSLPASNHSINHGLQGHQESFLGTSYVKHCPRVVVQPTSSPEEDDAMISKMINSDDNNVNAAMLLTSVASIASQEVNHVTTEVDQVEHALNGLKALTMPNLEERGHGDDARPQNEVQMYPGYQIKNDFPQHRCLYFDSNGNVDEWRGARVRAVSHDNEMGEGGVVEHRTQQHHPFHLSPRFSFESSSNGRMRSVSIDHQVHEGCCPDEVGAAMMHHRQYQDPAWKQQSASAATECSSPRTSPKVFQLTPITPPSLKKTTTTTAAVVSPQAIKSSNPKRVQVKTILRRKFSWKNYPELEAFLIANREEYLRHSALNYTVQQKQYNNRLTKRLLELAAEHGYVFDEDAFNFVTVRDRIRCYFKSYVQSSKKRGVIIGYAARRAGLLSEEELERSAGTAGEIIVPNK